VSHGAGAWEEPGCAQTVIFRLPIGKLRADMMETTNRPPSCRTRTRSSTTGSLTMPNRLARLSRPTTMQSRKTRRERLKS
jgi:hypothetical protein